MPRARVEIGDADGRIALFLNEQSAIDLAHTFGPSDLAYRELLDAVEKAYPPVDEDAPRLEIRLVARPRLPLFESGNPDLADEVSKEFG